MNIYEQILTYLCIIQETKNRDIPPTKRKIEFSKVLQSLCLAKYKIKNFLCFNS